MLSKDEQTSVVTAKGLHLKYSIYAPKFECQAKEGHVSEATAITDYLNVSISIVCCIYLSRIYYEMTGN